MTSAFVLIGFYVYVGFNTVAVHPTNHPTLEACEKAKKQIALDLNQIEGRGLGIQKKAFVKLSCVEETKNARKTP